VRLETWSPFALGFDLAFETAPTAQEVRMRSLAVSLLASMVIATPATAKVMVPVTTCGQIVPKNAIGYLTADLDCTGSSNAIVGAVVLGTNATLDLRGYTLTTDAIFGVYCGGVTEQDGALKPCRVEGGTITGPITGHGVIGRRVQAANLTITGAAVYGIFSDGPLVAEGLDVSGCGSGGVRADKGARISGSTLTGNGLYGVLSGKGIRLLSSTVTGNDTDPTCAQGPAHCADLDSPRPPVLVDSTCDTSLGKPFNQNGNDWDVCTLD
jgi:hypothetical protein